VSCRVVSCRVVVRMRTAYSCCSSLFFFFLLLCFAVFQA